MLCPWKSFLESSTARGANGARAYLCQRGDLFSGPSQVRRDGTFPPWLQGCVKHGCPQRRLGLFEKALNLHSLDLPPCPKAQRNDSVPRRKWKVEEEGE